MMSKPISPLLPKKSQTTQAIIAPVALTEQQAKTIQNIAIASGAMSRYNTYRSQKPESRRITPRKRVFLCLLVLIVNSTMAPIYIFSMGDGAKNTRPEREIIPLDFVTSFEPLPALLLSGYFFSISQKD